MRPICNIVKIMKNLQFFTVFEGVVICLSSYYYYILDASPYAVLSENKSLCTNTIRNFIHFLGL